jgi:putative spermidine/putrescine transport system ATP-binding protein
MSTQEQSPTRSLPISVRNLTKTYGPHHALDDVSIDIRAGEFLTLLGPSGSGKTTLLMALAGFVSPDRGSIVFGDQEVITLSPHKRGLGMVFQSYALFPLMSVAENVAYPLKIRGVSKPDIARKVADALAMVQLEGFGERRIQQMSGGQRQRVALARAIVFEPRIILMDEPLSALDKKLREHMQIELKALHRKLGATIVYVTHDQREALTMSDRIAVLNQGRIEQIDDPESLYRRPRSLFVADFVGESVALAVERSGDSVLLRGKALKTLAGQGSGTGRHFLVLRPELIELQPPSASPDADLNLLDGTVRDIIFQGESVLVLVDVGGATQVGVRVPASRAFQGGIPAAGSPIALGLRREDALIVPETVA